MWQLLPMYNNNCTIIVNNITLETSRRQHVKYEISDTSKIIHILHKPFKAKTKNFSQAQLSPSFYGHKIMIHFYKSVKIAQYKQFNDLMPIIISQFCPELTHV